MRRVAECVSRKSLPSPDELREQLGLIACNNSLNFSIEDVWSRVQDGLDLVNRRLILPRWHLLVCALFRSACSSACSASCTREERPEDELACTLVLELVQEGKPVEIIAGGCDGDVGAILVTKQRQDDIKEEVLIDVGGLIHNIQPGLKTADLCSKKEKENRICNEYLSPTQQRKEGMDGMRGERGERTCRQHKK
jgi:hypothetical protein